ncbi:MAG: hypothetical protein ACOZCL_01205 [Bacillota bacterium]
MKDLKKKYIKMIRLEFDDLKEDIELLIENEREKMESGKISNYVFMENLTTLKHEIMSIESFENEVEKIDTAGCSDFNELVEKIKCIFIKKFKEFGFSETSIEILLRKLEKINKYFE